MAISTAYSGNWYTIVGSVADVRAELNRINAKVDKVLMDAPNNVELTCVVGSK